MLPFMKSRSTSPTKAAAEVHPAIPEVKTFVLRHFIWLTVVYQPAEDKQSIEQDIEAESDEEVEEEAEDQPHHQPLVNTFKPV